MLCGVTGLTAVWACSCCVENMLLALHYAMDWTQKEICERFFLKSVILLLK